VSEQYLLDANVFIEAKNRYYGLDICPGFWHSLISQHAAGRLFSIDRIRNELTQQDDELKQWLTAEIPKSFFKKTEDQRVIDEFQRMVTWVFDQATLTDPGKSEFASVADGWLIAYASVNQLTVVTHEIYAPEVRRRVPIPNVCVEFNVAYLDTFSMLRELGEKFIRSTKRRR